MEEVLDHVYPGGNGNVGSNGCSVENRSAVAVVPVPTSSTHTTNVLEVIVIALGSLMGSTDCPLRYSTEFYSALSASTPLMRQQRRSCPSEKVGSVLSILFLFTVLRWKFTIYTLLQESGWT